MYRNMFSRMKDALVQLLRLVAGSCRIRMKTALVCDWRLTKNGISTRGCHG